MGDIFIDITVINDSDLTKQREVHFLADTGATRAWIPTDIAKGLDIQEMGTVPIELANGYIDNLPYGLCKLEYEGEMINGTVIIGNEGIEPIAGTHLLEDFRLVLDMVHYTVTRSQAIRAK